MRKLLLFLLLATPALAQNHAHMLSGINAQSGTTYTMQASDVTKLVTFNSATTCCAFAFKSTSNSMSDNVFFIFLFALRFM